MARRSRRYKVQRPFGISASDPEWLGMKKIYRKSRRRKRMVKLANRFAETGIGNGAKIASILAEGEIQKGLNKSIEGAITDLVKARKDFYDECEKYNPNVPWQNKSYIPRQKIELGLNLGMDPREILLAFMPARKATWTGAFKFVASLGASWFYANGLTDVDTSQFKALAPKLLLYGRALRKFKILKGLGDPGIFSELRQTEVETSGDPYGMGMDESAELLVPLYTATRGRVNASLVALSKAVGQGGGWNAATIAAGGQEPAAPDISGAMKKEGV